MFEENQEMEGSVRCCRVSRSRIQYDRDEGRSPMSWETGLRKRRRIRVGGDLKGGIVPHGCCIVRSHVLCATRLICSEISFLRHEGYLSEDKIWAAEWAAIIRIQIQTRAQGRVFT